MHFDLVRAAGLTPKTADAWGLMTKEGYDVPATTYTPEEFRTLLRFSKNSMRDLGLPVIGFRSGGWFMNGPLLQTLADEGLLYDSSGRERPPNGAFHAIEWNLADTAVPYYPDFQNINNAAAGAGKLLEIPNNAGNTYELSVNELTRRIAHVYQSGPLLTPKILVYVSHPQFSSQEFAKIPQVLSELKKITSVNNSGPVVFVTMSEIYGLWTSSIK
jgi:hypothetical protein